MAIVRLNGGPLPPRDGGEVFYNRNGRATLRQVVSPLIFKSLTNIPFRNPPINDQAYECARLKQAMMQWRGLTAAQKAAWTAASPFPNGPAYVAQIMEALRRNNATWPGPILVPSTGALSVNITAFHFIGTSLRLSTQTFFPVPAPAPPITEDKAYLILFATPPGQWGKAGKYNRAKCIGRSLCNVILEPLNTRYRMVFGVNPQPPIRIRVKPVAVYLPAVGPDSSAAIPPGI